MTTPPTPARKRKPAVSRKARTALSMRFVALDGEIEEGRLTGTIRHSAHSLCAVEGPHDTAACRMLTGVQS